MKISNLLIHPLFLFALAVLLLNDFIFKYTYPGEITGKLSDIAGLIVLSLIIYSVYPSFFQLAKRKIILLFTVGLSLTLLQFQSFLDLLNLLLSFTFLPSHNLTADLTDLFTLMVLPLVYWFLVHYEREKEYRNYKRSAILKLAVFILSFFSLLATSFPTGTNKLLVNNSIAPPSNSTQIIHLISEELTNNGYKQISDTLINDSTSVLSFRFKAVEKADTANVSKYSDYYEGELYFLQNTKRDSIRVKEFRLLRYANKVTDKEIDSVFVTQIQPIINRARLELGKN